MQKLPSQLLHLSHRTKSHEQRWRLSNISYLVAVHTMPLDGIPNLRFQFPTTNNAEAGELSWYSDYPMGCTIHGLIPSRDKRFLSSLSPCYHVWSPRSLLFSGYYSLFLQVWPRHEADHSPALLLKLRMSGVEALLLSAFMAWTWTALPLTIHNIIMVPMNTSEIGTTLMPYNADSWNFYVNGF